MTGRGVHRASAGLERDDTCPARRPNRARTADAGSECARTHRLSSARPARPKVRPVAAADRRCERLRDNDGAAVDVERGVVELRMKRDRQIRWNRPGRRRPDQNRHVTSRERRALRATSSDVRSSAKREFHVDRRRRVIFVLDFGFRERASGSECTSGPASCPCRRGPCSTNLPNARAIAA
mgnify:CR=1 FL=1